MGDIYEKAVKYAIRFPNCGLRDLQRIIDSAVPDGSATVEAIRLYDRLADDGFIKPKISKHFIRRARNAILNSRDGVIHIENLKEHLGIGCERTYYILCCLYKKGIVSSFEGVISRPYNFIVTRPSHIKRNWKLILGQALTVTRKYGRNDELLLQRVMFVNSDESAMLYKEVEDELVRRAAPLLKERGELSLKMLWKEMRVRRKTAKIILNRLGIISPSKIIRHKKN